MTIEGAHSFVPKFQSTLPARGATKAPAVFVHNLLDFNPRSPRGERHGRRNPSLRCKYFNPRSPRGERPIADDCVIVAVRISIHAPREGSDGYLPLWVTHFSYFNPRSPRGERQGRRGSPARSTEDFNPRSPRGERRDVFAAQLAPWKFQSTLPARGATVHGLSGGRTERQFQSTLPARGATAECQVFSSNVDISIHAPREGSDSCRHPAPCGCGYFNPRSPRGERPKGVFFISARQKFQSTLPARGATLMPPGSRAMMRNFNPRSPRGERRRWA